MDQVSVIIPCFNASRFLRETLESVLAQTVPPFEVILIDDGSTDDSVQIAESFGHRLKIIRQANQGESVARNVGLDLARGQWIAFLDADDRWVPERLERLQSIYRSAKSDASIISNAFFRFGAAGVGDADMVRPTGLDSRTVVDHLAGGGYLPSATVVRAALTRDIRFPTHVQVNEDLWYFCELLNLSPCLYVAERLTGWRVSANQQSRASDYEFHAVQTRMMFVADHRESFTDHELKCLQQAFCQRLATAHDNAYWKRDLDTVRRVRQLYREQAEPLGMSDPDSFSRVLHPAIVYRLYDWFDAKFRPKKAARADG
ncbi:putative glycosyltransferase EpsJ [Roseimaritima ulvae]|uniref:Putative glycosyltransferase EpsJ n=1 Tax=Roseimaritima ulvae TaxID=980254 RepID=A0A5B9QYM0_9BACT|nr:glycosyltransferase family A protein [Roseimaritima ulvae]QEG42495.1 putative glycosyltransferase EpsJ [Roseimaritima ulvae]